MKALFLAHYPQLYGSIRSLLDLTDGLQVYGIQPFFVVPAEGSFSAALQEKQLPYAIVPVPYWLSQKPLSLQGKMQLLREIHLAAQSVLSLIEGEHIDLVYTNTSTSPVGALAARRASIPHIWHIREFGDLDFNLKFVFSTSLSLWIISRSEAVIFHAKAVQKHFFKNAYDNMHQVYNGVASNREFDFRIKRRQTTTLPQVFTFLMPSIISPNKGQVTAIRAIKELSRQGIDCYLILAGGGKSEYIQQLMEMSEALQLTEKVQFIGLVNDPIPLYYQASCALVCSNYEALSRVALEAMSCGLPVIGRNTGGTPEIILNGQTGYLYDNFDALVESMAALAQNPELSQRMGLAGWARARELFNTEDCAAKVFEIIQSVTNKA